MIGCCVVLLSLTALMSVATFSYPLSVERIEIGSNITAARGPMPGDQVFIMTPVENQAAEQKNFTYIVLITDEDGFTVYLELVQGTLVGYEKTKVSSVWIPDRPGNFTIDTFFWKDITNSQIPLARSLSTTIHITSIPPNNSTGIGSLRGADFFDPILMATESEPEPGSQADYVTTSMSMMHTYEFNVIRVPYNWEAYEADPARFLQEAEFVASTARSAGIKVFFDNHHWFASSYFDTGIAGSGFPHSILAGYQKVGPYDTVAKPFWIDFWNDAIEVNGEKVWDLQADFIAQLINKVDKYDNVIGYEILNEPHLWYTGEYTEIGEYAKLGKYYTYMAQKLRLHTDKMIFFTRETTHGGLARQPWLEPLIIPQGVSNIVYSPHLYHVPLPDSDAVDQVQNFKDYQQAWKQRGHGDIPILIGEFAASTQSDMDAFIKTFKDAGFGWTYWIWWPTEEVNEKRLVDINLQPTIYLQYLQNSMSKYP